MVEAVGVRSGLANDAAMRLIVQFWIASTVTDLGTYITPVAFTTIFLVTLGETAQDHGWASGARWAPYLLFALMACIWVDPFNRKTVLGRADWRGILLALLA